jgi:signal transduction histidine kinase
LISIRTLSDMEIKYIDYNYAKNRIFGSFCHELRTPINSIINTLDTMQQAQADEMMSFFDDYDENLMNATVSSHLLLNEIDDFIDYFAYCNDMLEVNPVPFEISSFFQEIQRIFAYFSMKKNIGFSVDIDKNVPFTLYNDEKRVKQIIFNLISEKKKKIITYHLFNDKF